MTFSQDLVLPASPLALTYVRSNLWFALLSSALILTLIFFLYKLKLSSQRFAEWPFNESKRIQGNGIPGTNLLGFIGERLQGLRYLLMGPSSLQSGYTRVSWDSADNQGSSADFNKARGGWFKIATPLNNHLLVTSEEHIREVANAPLQQLSLHAVAKEVPPLLCFPRAALTCADTTTKIHHVWL